MNRSLMAWTVGIAVVALAAAVWLPRGPAQDIPAQGESAVMEPVIEATPELVRPEQLEAEAIDAMRQRIADLELALEASIELRCQAEGALETSEEEIEELEAFVEGIEMRGEDPVDYADEGLERFQPAFMRYQDAAAAYEQAEALEQEARSALADARAELEALEANGPER